MSSENVPQASTSRQSLQESEDRVLYSEFVFLSEIELSINSTYVIDSNVAEYDATYSPLRKERIFTEDNNTLFVSGYGRVPKRCKINFMRTVYNEVLYEIDTSFKIENDYMAEINYVRESRITRWTAHNDALLCNYVCGDTSFSCCKFYHLSYYEDRIGLTKETVLCESCYYFQSNTTNWVVYNILGCNKMVTCNMIHIHSSGHFHCFKCLMDCKNYHRCLRYDVSEIDECFTYWTSVPRRLE